MPLYLLLLSSLAHAEPAAPVSVPLPELVVPTAGDVKVGILTAGLDPAKGATCVVQSKSGPVALVQSAPPTIGVTGLVATFPGLAAGTWGGACVVNYVGSGKAPAAVVNVELPPVAAAAARTSNAAGLHTFTQAALPSLPSANGTSGGSRSALDATVPAIVTDSLALLAEIAFDKAKSRSYAILAEQVTTLVCDKAALGTPLVLAVNGAGSVGAGGPYRFAVSLPAGRLLPATCAAVGGLDSFVAWANSAPTIAGAVESDALDVGGAILTGMKTDALSDWQQAQVSFALGAVFEVLRDDVVNRTRPDATDARALLYKLATRDWQKDALDAATPDPKHFPKLEWNGTAWNAAGNAARSQSFAEREAATAFGLQLSFAIASYCTPSAGAPNPECTVERVLALADNPDKNFPGNPIAPGAWDEVKPAVTELATSLYTLTQSNVKDPVRALATLAMDILDLTMAVDAASGGAIDEGATTIIGQARPLFTALLDGDLPGAVIAGLDVVQTVLGLAGEAPVKGCSLKGQKPIYEALQAVNRIAPVVTTIASNAQNLKQAATADEATQDALREARKESLQALVDASTKRDDRWGDPIIGLGANVGVAPVVWTADGGKLESSSVFFVATDSNDTLASLPVTMPMGIALDWYPGRKPPVHGWRTGLHFQLSPVDIAQFLPDSTESGDATEDVQWSDFLMGGAQVGLNIGRPQDTFNVAVDARYAPYEQGAPYRVALQLSYFVPFFDFN